jgi:hypothetical protein
MRQKILKSAAVAYNEGIKSQGAAAGFNRYISAASSWSMANSPDSAFYVLDILSKNTKLTQSDYKNIESAKELAALQSDKRWNPLLAAVQKQAEANTYPQEEFVYGRKDGMGLLMTQLKPKREDQMVKRSSVCKPAVGSLISQWWKEVFTTRGSTLTKDTMFLWSFLAHSHAMPFLTRSMI